VETSQRSGSDHVIILCSLCAAESLENRWEKRPNDNKRTMKIRSLRVSSNSDLPFKIPITSSEWAHRFPHALVVGKAEYQACIDLWLGRPWNFASETAVSALDQLWITVCTNCVAGITVLLNQHDPSSRVSLRPDTTLMIHGALVAKGEAK
jgi:hypothetical protein